MLISKTKEEMVPPRHSQSNKKIRGRFEGWDSYAPSAFQKKHASLNWQVYCDKEKCIKEARVKCDVGSKMGLTCKRFYVAEQRSHCFPITDANWSSSSFFTEILITWLTIRISPSKETDHSDGSVVNIGSKPNWRNGRHWQLKDKHGT